MANPMFNITYGLYVLTAKDGEKDNGCIINTFSQLTSIPERVTVVVNKQNFTCTMIEKTGKFNVSVLTQETPFEIFKHFGFQSGKDCEKFFANPDAKRSENGIIYLPEYTNAYFSCTVTDTLDFETHVMFVAVPDEMQVLSDVPSLSYDYYHKNIKPQPKTDEGKKNGFRCKICGYVYEGDELPADYICPLCKHGAEDFEKIQ